MDIVAKYRLISKLIRIVEDEASSEAEKNNARDRITEIKNKLSEYSICLNKNRTANISRDKRTISVFKKNLQRGVPYFPIDLVFGWDKKVIVEVCSVFDDVNKVIFLEWKCPCCGGHVERIITQKHRARLLGKPNGIRNFINGIRKGDINQLCNDCYEKHR